MDSRYRPVVRYADGRYRKSVLRHTTIEDTLQGLYEPVSDVWWASLKSPMRKRLLSIAKCASEGVVVYARRHDFEHGYEDVWLDALCLNQRCDLSTMDVASVNLKECCICFVPEEDTPQWYQT